MMTGAQRTLMGTFSLQVVQFYMKTTVMLLPQSAILGSSTQSLHIWGKKKIRDAMIQTHKKPKKEKYSFSLTINAKALCLSEKSIFPSVLHCTNGGGICISK